MNLYRNDSFNQLQSPVYLNKNIAYIWHGDYLEKNQEKIFLSLTEARLFRYLVMNANKRVLMEEIIHHLGGYSPSLTEQNVYVYISRLRKKIEDDPKKPKLLLNLRPGYLLNVETGLYTGRILQNCQD